MYNNQNEEPSILEDQNIFSDKKKELMNKINNKLKDFIKSQKEIDSFFKKLIEKTTSLQKNFKIKINSKIKELKEIKNILEDDNKLIKIDNIYENYKIFGDYLNFYNKIIFKINDKLLIKKYEHLDLTLNLNHEKIKIFLKNNKETDLDKKLIFNKKFTLPKNKIENNYFDKYLKIINNNNLNIKKDSKRLKKNNTLKTNFCFAEKYKSVKKTENKVMNKKYNSNKNDLN